MPPPSTGFRTFGPVIVILIVIGVIYLLKQPGTNSPSASTTPAAGPGEYLFCTWNLENFFDDQRDNRNQIDEEYDRWFAENPEILRLKLSHLAGTLDKMNGGKGPDILVRGDAEQKGG